jgi:hypothetical protein
MEAWALTLSEAASSLYNQGKTFCKKSVQILLMYEGIVGRVGRATARNALYRGFDPCRQRPRGVAVDFGRKQSGWLINQLGDPSFMKTSKLTARNEAKTAIT